MNPSIVLVDICGTLYDSNTTFDFLDFSIQEKKYVLFRKLSKSIYWKLLNKISIWILHLDFTRTVAVWFLKGMSEEQLAKMMDAFYKERLSLVKQKDVMNLVNKYISDGMRVILVSATLDFISKKISEEMEINECYSTMLNYIDNICQGTIKSDLLSNKFEFLTSHGFHANVAVSITDNFSDLKLLKASGEAIIVSKENNKTKWVKVLQKAKIEHYSIITI
jgi:phosphoserine phosphatase